MIILHLGYFWNINLLYYYNMEENKFSGILSINDFGNGFVNCEYNNDKIVVFVSKKKLEFWLT